MFLISAMRKRGKSPGKKHGNFCKITSKSHSWEQRRGVRGNKKLSLNLVKAPFTLLILLRQLNILKLTF